MQSLLLFSKRKRKHDRGQGQGQGQNSTLPQSISPLAILEILEIILAYCDEVTLRRASLVCYQWFIICRNQIVLELAYDDTRHPRHKRLEKALSRLQGAAKFRWAANEVDRGKNSDVREWKMLTAALQDNHKRYMHSQRAVINTERRWWREAVWNTRGMRRGWRRHGPPLLVSSHLQELEINGYVHLETRFTPLLPYLQSLKVLRLRSHYQSSVYMDEVLHSCPKLTHLHIEGLSDYINLPAPWRPSDTTPLVGCRRPVTNTGQNQFQIQHDHLSLRSLVLHSVFLLQSSLECLLTVTPGLKELKLMNSKLPPTEQRARYNPDQLLWHLQKLNLPIQSFHFSPDMVNPHLTEVDVFERMSMFHQQSQYSFMADNEDMPMMFRILRGIPNHVTTLELADRHEVLLSDAVQDALHEYLCVSRHLLHLKAPHFNYYYRCMDIHHRLPGNVDSAVMQSGIWACRNLRTLYIMVKIPVVPKCQVSKFSRVVFGYIARVCPQLKDLQIQMVNTALGIESGLCLLTRLKDLETLYITTNGIYPRVQQWELDWMAHGRSSGLLRSKRQEAVAGWEDAIKMEAKDLNEQEQSPLTTAMWDGRASWDVALTLRDLGLLVDVKLMLDHIDTTVEFRCWPVLYRSGVYIRKDRQNVMETTFARMLPGTRFVF
ncbi:hypothetical protein BGZ50_005670 [Haplosporangium sp. Z 11]|nr:hypothetical protein BGZ50_005670 [Haplosporangium sp. Z 11]